MGISQGGRPRRRIVVVVVTAILACGLVWGLAQALASSSSPSPAGKVVLKLGMTTSPTT